ncbi:MAG: serine/threonine-protein kinase [Elusimicrobiota bacterium]|jgi:serine/threonine protein kinase
MADILEGSELGGCRIERFLARGGMGEVYQALHLRLDRVVALKLLSPELAARKEVVEAFTREARAAARLEHPRIVQVYDAGFDKGRHFIILQFVDGETLQERIRRVGRISPVESLRILSPVLEALQEAHGQGIVHRDVKPGNILLGKDGTIRLSDFGLALRPSDRKDGQPGGVGGTPEYMAPELGWGTPADSRSDLYALGATWFHMLAGHPPFEGKTAEDTLTMHVQEPLPDIRKINPDVSDGIAEAISRMMAKSREERCASAGEVLADLRSPALFRDETPGMLADERMLDLGTKSVPGQPRAAVPSASESSPKDTGRPGPASSIDPLPVYRPRSNSPVVMLTMTSAEPKPGTWTRRLLCAALLAAAGISAYPLGRYHEPAFLTLSVSILLAGWVVSRGGVRMVSLFLGAGGAVSFFFAGHYGTGFPVLTAEALRAHLLPVGLGLGAWSWMLSYGLRRTRWETRLFPFLLAAAVFSLHAGARPQSMDHPAAGGTWVLLAAGAVLAVLAASIGVLSQGPVFQGARWPFLFSGAALISAFLSGGVLQPLFIEVPSSVPAAVQAAAVEEEAEQSLSDDSYDGEAVEGQGEVSVVLAGSDEEPLPKKKPRRVSSSAAPAPVVEKVPVSPFSRFVMSPLLAGVKLLRGTGAILSVGWILLGLSVLSSLLSAAAMTLRHEEDIR